MFQPLVDRLCGDDPFLALADYRAYLAAQAEVDAAWRDRQRWTRMSILNSARSGHFSADRAIREYCEEIWQVPACSVERA